MAVLNEDFSTARNHLRELFDNGFRDKSLLLRDPILSRLSDTDEYRLLLEKISVAVETAWQSISKGAEH